MARNDARIKGFKPWEIEVRGNSPQANNGRTKDSMALENEDHRKNKVN